MRNTLSFITALFIMIACQPQSESAGEKSNLWRGELQLNDSNALPFLFEWDGVKMVVHNASEKIELTDIERKGDSLILHFPVFQTALHVKDHGDSWTGHFVKYDAENYFVPFTAQRGDSLRFHAKNPPDYSVNSHWQVELRTGTENARPAIAEFSQSENGMVTGSFITETGDYRFLEGVLDGNELKLAGFDGTHAYLFVAKVEGDNIRGIHYSGLTYAQPWKAVRNDSFRLRNPNELTLLKPGMDSVHFTLPDLNHELFSFRSTKLSGPVIIQILGSWCPNCMDESRYLKTLYEKHSTDGLDIIGISFERSGDFETAEPAIGKMIRDLDIPYKIVFGGKASGESVAQTLPMIDQFMSYPTSIFIDKTGKVRMIHTGFAGPGTSAYDRFVQETDAFVAQLVKE